MKLYRIVMGLALAGSAGLVLFGDRAPGGDMAEAVQRRPARAGVAVAKSAAAVPAAAIMRLQPREALIGAPGGEFATHDALFDGQDWNPPPPPPAPAQATAPPAPVAPPLPFICIGKARSEDGAWDVFLSRADRVYVVRLNTVIDGVYRVDAIAPPAMTLTYLPMQQAQQLNIGVNE
jgi:hypothetical protein